MTKNLIFQLDYLPVAAHYNNLRYFFKKTVWEIIVANVREFKNYQCEFCGRKFNSKNNQSLRYLHCHELWSFNYEKNWQILDGLLLLCNNCHNCQHFNFACLKGKENQTINHFMKVNNLSVNEYHLLKRENKLFRKNYTDQTKVTREQLDQVNNWLFINNCDLPAIFINKENGKKIQKFLEQISNLNK